MNVAVEVHIDVRQAVGDLEGKAKAMDPLRFLPAIGQRLLNWVDENFRKHGAEQPWRPLSPNTIASRRKGRGAGSPQPLRDTGRMAQSFVMEVQGADAVWVGTRDEKAEWHHLGTQPYTITTKPPGRMARRQRSTRTGRTRGRATRFRGALAFKTPRGILFRRSVRHPGIPARPLLPSPDLAHRLATEALQVFADRALGGR